MCGMLAFGSGSGRGSGILAPRLSHLRMDLDGAAAGNAARRGHRLPGRVLGKRWSLEDGDLHLDVYSRQMAKLASVIGGIAAISDEMEQVGQPSSTTTMRLVLFRL